MTPNRSYHFQARLVLLATIVLSGLVLLATLVWLSHPARVSANSNDFGLAEAKYPNMGGSRIDSCSLCHTSPPSLNPYGAAYLAAGRNSAAFAAIENLDSDGDGWTNIQEITALTFPGDPNDHPAAATPSPTPTATGLPTQTAVPTQTNTAVSSATSTPVGNPSSTPVSSATSTSVSSPTSTPVASATSTKIGEPTSTKVEDDDGSGDDGGDGDDDSTRTPRPEVTNTPNPDRTPRPSRTPEASPTPCHTDHEDGSYNNLDGGLLRTLAMTYDDNACHHEGGRGND